MRWFGIGAVVLALLGLAALGLHSRAHPYVGPKLIEADGASYVAGDGLIWLNNGVRPAIISTYTVLYRDAQGLNHELRYIKSLKITDLPADAPACRAAIKSTESEAIPQTHPTMHAR